MSYLRNNTAARGLGLSFRRRPVGHGLGPAGGASFVGPLDDYTADMAGAWSVARRLLSSYEGALIRVRRSSDSAELDIGYDTNGNLDTATLLSFCGAGDGFLRWRYDQSGNGRHFGQATAVNQPQVVSSGSLFSDGSFSAEKVTSSTSMTQAGSVAGFFGTASGLILMRLYQAGAVATGRVLNVNPSAPVNCWTTFSDNNLYFDYGGSASGRVNAAQPSGWDDAWHWVRFTRDSGVQSIHVDGVSLVSASRSATNSATEFTIFCPLDHGGFMRDVVFWTNGSDGAAKEAALMA